MGDLNGPACYMMHTNCTFFSGLLCYIDYQIRCIFNSQANKFPGEKKCTCVTFILNKRMLSMHAAYGNISSNIVEESINISLIPAMINVFYSKLYHIAIGHIVDGKKTDIKVLS